MIVADESARELSLGVEDLIDAGEHGAGPAPLAGPESLPAARAARMAALERARAEGARTELEREVPLTWRDWTLQVAVSADVLRPDARGAALEQIRVVPDADPDAGAARALERAGFAALLFDLAGEPIARVAVVELSLEGARRAGVGVGVGHHADLLQRGTARVGAQHVGRDRDVERPVAPGERNLALELGARALGTRALERSHARGTCRGE